MRRYEIHLQVLGLRPQPKGSPLKRLSVFHFIRLCFEGIDKQVHAIHITNVLMLVCRGLFEHTKKTATDATRKMSVTDGFTACNPFTTASFATTAVLSTSLSKATNLKNGRRGKQDIQVCWESGPRLGGDPLKGVAQTGYSALFPPP